LRPGPNECALGYRRVTEPWAILCRHRLDPEVPQHSVNPCLVADAGNVGLGGEPAVQDTEKGGSSEVPLKQPSASYCGGVEKAFAIVHGPEPNPRYCDPQPVPSESGVIARRRLSRTFWDTCAVTERRADQGETKH
jgi:hypothetical protein